MKCRHCSQDLRDRFLDLGVAPPSNAYVSAESLNAPETFFPLRVQVCRHCWLVQTEDYASAESLFTSDYAYFSSVSRSWMEHAARYVKEVSARLNLGAGSFVIEVASNDGYLLRNFVSAGVPCLGIEPTESTAKAAESQGVPTLRKFFGAELARQLVREGRGADLILGNNVYAHVPDINDFTSGLEIVLKPGGTITLEFPHLLELIRHTQFDTVYHEHFSYLSLTAVSRVFERAGLRVFDVQKLGTHGGSLRIFGCRTQDPRGESATVRELLKEEQGAGLDALPVYENFQAAADRVKDGLLQFLIEQKAKGVKVAAYGAAAKGNTLLNYAGVKADLLPFVCDAAPSKMNRFLPGSRIPILAPSALREHKPDIVLILPWNIAAEVAQQHSYIREWGGRFAVAVPRLSFLA